MPIITFGQGFILDTTILFNNIVVDEINKIDNIYDQNDFYILTNDGEVDIKNIVSKESWNLGKSDYISFGSIAVVKKTILYERNSKLVKKSNRKSIAFLPKSLDRKNDILIKYAYQDEKYLYLFTYYNNNAETELGHDVIHCFKILRKNRHIVLNKKIDIGKEIILAPFNQQIITFTGNRFLIASPVTTEITSIDKNLEITKKFHLDTTLSLANSVSFNKVFPDKNAGFYLYKPRDVIYHYNNSELIDLKVISKIIALNDSLVLVNYRLKHRDIYLIEIINVNSNKAIWEKQINHTGEELSPLCWTRRAYFSSDDELCLISLYEPDDSTILYKAKIYSFNHNVKISKDIFSEYQLLSPEQVKVDLSLYSGVVLADEYFCKGCYSNYGTGEGVLVIKKYDFRSTARLNADYSYFMRNWAISGELCFVDSETYNHLKNKMSPNVLYPFEE